MEATMMTLSQDELGQLYVARQARLEALKAGLMLQPVNAETRFARRLVTRALYTNWLDMQELKTSAAVALAR